MNLIGRGLKFQNVVSIGMHWAAGGEKVVIYVCGLCSTHPPLTISKMTRQAGGLNGLQKV